IPLPKGYRGPPPGFGVSPIGINLRATPFPKRCRVLPAGVQGVSPKTFFFSRAACGGARKERRFSRGHPLYPAKGRLPLGTPLKLTPMGVSPHIPPFSKAAVGGARRDLSSYANSIFFTRLTTAKGSNQDLLNDNKFVMTVFY